MVCQLAGKLPFKSDIIYGVVGYGAANGEEPEWDLFGSVLSEKAPDALGDNVNGKFNFELFGQTAAYKGSVLCFPLLPRKSRKDEVANNYEASLALYGRIWMATSAVGDTVGDFGCGSGSGAIAALLMGRNVIAIDKDREQVTFVMGECFCFGSPKWRLGL